MAPSYTERHNTIRAETQKLISSAFTADRQVFALSVLI
jgi:hypothetical protein